jgi:hypothetical protein
VENAIKRKQGKQAKHEKKHKKVAGAKKVVASDSNLLDESMHNLESRIPCEKKVSIKNVCLNSKGKVVDIKNSNLEDDCKMPKKISHKNPRRSLIPWTRTLSPVKMRTPRLSK